AALQCRARIYVEMEFLRSHVMYSSTNDREHIRLAENEQLLAIHGHFRAAVLPVQHLVADFHFHRHPLPFVEPARTHRDDLTLLRLLLGGGRDVETTPHLLRLFQRLHDDPVSQRADFRAHGTLRGHTDTYLRDLSC